MFLNAVLQIVCLYRRTVRGHQLNQRRCGVWCAGYSERQIKCGGDEEIRSIKYRVASSRGRARARPPVRPFLWHAAGISLCRQHRRGHTNRYPRQHHLHILNFDNKSNRFHCGTTMSACCQLRMEAVALYRASLRAARSMPTGARRKVAYNIRSIFELRQ